MRKAAHIHDVLADDKLDVLALTESWVKSTDPNAITNDIAPPGFAVKHRPRSSSTRGGGLALVYREDLKATVIASSNQFEQFAVKLSVHSLSVLLVVIYRRPGAVTVAFCDALSDLCESLLAFKHSFILCGDFNCPRENGTGINVAVADIFMHHNMTQHVDLATHNSGHTLDLLVTRDDDNILSARPSARSLCFSDHYLVSSQLRLNRDVPVPVTYTYRPLRHMNIDAFKRDLCASSLFLDDVNITVDDYADLIDVVVTRALDIHAPLRTMKKRQGKHDCRWLSAEARAAKRKRRRLERRYRRTRCAKDKREYTAAAKEAKTLITRSRSDDITQRLNEVTGDSRATWRVAQEVLHSKPRPYYDDSECAHLINAF